MRGYNPHLMETRTTSWERSLATSCCVVSFLPRCSLLMFPVMLLLPFTWAQQCSPPVLRPSHALNLLDEQQEYDLGEVFAEQISFSLHVIEDDEVAGRLQEIGNRLVSEMPPTKLRFRFFIVDSPVANAFAIPGGRVYVTRRLVTTVRSEDELAGVIGHEMGHQLAHHGALDWSRIFQNVLGVSKLGDRADIEDKFNRYLDIYRTKGSATSRSNEENEQTGADQVAVYAVARAGYSPQAVIDFWDRFVETKGNKGTWLSDFFGTMRPESKRLREFVKDLSSMPKGCIQQAADNPSSADFAKWQAAVKNYNGFGKKESLQHLLLKRPLDPAMRSDIRKFRFSTDGKYLLAQDSSSIFVLTREPLANLFRVDAPEAVDATFSPDSRYVVVYSEGLRIERWNIAEQRLEDVREPYIYRGCVQAAVSPDGAYLACLRADHETLFPVTFTLYDTDSGSAVLTRKDFIGPAPNTTALFNAYLALASNKGRFATMAFSPDGRYLVLGRHDQHLLIDLPSLSEVNMPGPLRRITARSFAFVGSDKVVGADEADLQEATLVKFPSGEVVSEHIPIGGRSVYPVTQGSFAIVRPMLKAPLGIMDLDAKKIFRASHTDATDIVGDVVVSERVSGEIGLYHLREEKPFATVILPKSMLGQVSASAVAPHASSIAISQRTRGAVWSLQTGAQLASGRGFHGAFFGADGVYFDFSPLDQYKELPKIGETAKDVRRREADEDGDLLARVDLATRSTFPILTLKKRTYSHLSGSVLLTWTPADDDQPRRNVTLEAHEAQTGKVLWSRFFAKGFPWIQTQGDSEVGVFSWRLGTKTAKEELSGNPEAKRLADKVWEAENSYLIEIVNLRSGSVMGAFPVDTGNASFAARQFLASGDTVVMVDSNNRICLYSFKGEKEGCLFGGNVALSPDGRRLCVEREPGRLILYDIEKLRELDEMTFGSRVAHVNFTDDSSQFVVVTADQTAYLFASRPG